MVAAQGQNVTQAAGMAAPPKAPDPRSFQAESTSSEDAHAAHRRYFGAHRTFVRQEFEPWYRACLVHMLRSDAIWVRPLPLAALHHHTEPPGVLARRVDFFLSSVMSWDMSDDEELDEEFDEQ